MVSRIAGYLSSLIQRSALMLSRALRSLVVSSRVVMGSRMVSKESIMLLRRGERKGAAGEVWQNRATRLRLTRIDISSAGVDWSVK